jgi:hypothetical protein
MNERIKELAEQVTTRKFDGTGADTGKLVLDEQKFAELIVNDLCKIIKGQKIKEPPDGYQDWENGYNAALKHALTQIKSKYENKL